MTVAPPPIAANCVTITAVQGVTITPVTMTATGGTGTGYTFSASGLPSGLTMSSSGTISGTPTVSGTFNYTVTVTDSGGNKGTFNCSVTVAPPPIAANCVTITAVQGVTITPVTMTATGGTGTGYTFSASGLPSGLTMSSSGTISGTPTVSGTFNYTVTVKDSAGDTGTFHCSVTVGTTAPVAKDEFATIGFWHNQNGQALIDSLNGGGASTALGDWLASTFPNLYGASSSNNMAGQTNAAVAALFLKLFNVSGQKTDAQVLAGALAVYATNTTLAGGNYAAGYGFHVSTLGSGVATYNTGSDGTAIGLANNTSYTVLQLLNAANAAAPWNHAAFNALNDIFDGINQKGDIS